jgi:molybdenum cofactor synthesis domain-containing protein
MRENSVELLTIGNEVLAGDVLDSNSHWLCGQISALGAQVRRITVLPDDPAQIADGLLGALGRAPKLILTCGGLGPTSDDLTVAAIGAALGLPVEEDPVARAMIRDFYAELHRRGHVTTAEMLPARSKMAQMPLGADPLRNAVGAAPGVLLTRDATTIVCMPGVPAEMKDIFTNSLAPRLPALFGAQTYSERVIKTDAWDESILAPAVNAVAARHPLVYVKSRAQVYGGGNADFVTLAARGADKAEVTALLDAAEHDLRNALHEIGIATS